MFGLLLKKQLLETFKGWGKEWRTNFERDVGGKFAFRGFKGTYELEATANGKTVRREFGINTVSPNSVDIII